MPSPERRIQIGLFAGLMLLFLSIWKGDGGYHDLREYLDNAENLWLKGDLCIPGKPGKYYFHPLGSAVLAGPFVLAGAAIEKLTAGAVGHRSIAALCIPVYSALACVFIYVAGRELAFSALICLWAAVILALGSPMLHYTRLFYAEGCIALSLCVAIWAFLRSRRAKPQTVSAWLLLAGAGLAGVTACHFNNLFISFWLWVAICFAILGDTAFETGRRTINIIALTAMPVVAGGALLYMNARRFGGPFQTGYESHLEIESAHPISLLNVPRNYQYLILWLICVPWILPAILNLKAFRIKDWYLAGGILFAVISEIVLFQVFTGTHPFPIRYHQSLVVLLSLPLMLLAEALWKRSGERGLLYGGLLLILWNLAVLFQSDTTSHVLIFSQTGDTVTAGPPFTLSQEGDTFNAYVWYMAPLLESNRLRTPMGTAQWITLGALLTFGCAILAVTFRKAHRMSMTEMQNNP